MNLLLETKPLFCLKRFTYLPQWKTDNNTSEPKEQELQQIKTPDYIILVENKF